MSVIASNKKKIEKGGTGMPLSHDQALITRRWPTDIVSNGNLIGSAVRYKSSRSSQVRQYRWTPRWLGARTPSTLARERHTYIERTRATRASLVRRRWTYWFCTWDPTLKWHTRSSRVFLCLLLVLSSKRLSSADKFPIVVNWEPTEISSLKLGFGGCERRD